MNIRPRDRWYRVGLFQVSLVAGLAAGPAQGQSIHGVTGVPDHGSDVVITGSSFGDKSNPAPLRWDSFESGSDGEAITVADGWDAVDGWSSSAGAHIRPPYFNSAVKHAGNLGMTCRFEGDTENSSVGKDADYSTGSISTPGIDMHPPRHLRGTTRSF